MQFTLKGQLVLAGTLGVGLKTMSVYNNQKAHTWGGGSFLPRTPRHPTRRAL